MNLIEYTKSFAEKKSTAKTEDRNSPIGTISMGIHTRKYIRDRKGRKRRIRVEAESQLMTGPGAMTKVAAINGLKKEFGNMKQTKILLTQEKFRKIMEIFKNNKK